MKKWFPYPQLLDHVSPKVIQGRIQRLKRGVKIEKVRICFATLESVELHICFFVIFSDVDRSEKSDFGPNSDQFLEWS